MDPHLSPDGREFILKWFAKAKEERAPIHGSLELTARCNLKCLHCYLPSKKPGVSADELDTAEWLNIIEQIAEAGCLFLLLTGGDPLLRSDFDVLYRKAKWSGLMTSVFCNGSLVTEAHCRLFRELPPRHMEITLYGATRETYESVTQIPGSFDRCIRGIERLLDCGVKLNLKTIVMSMNEPEYDAMVALAEHYGCSFHMDAQVFPRLDGDKTPLQYRVTAEEAARHEFDTEIHRRSWRKYAERSGKPLPAKKLYQCGAGVCSFHVTSSGILQPCVLSDDVRYDLRKGSFLDGWCGEMPALRDLAMPPETPCAACDLRALCGMCPPISKRETGQPMAPVEFFCQLGAAREREVARAAGERQDGGQHVSDGC